MASKTQLIQAKRLQQEGRIADLILKDQYRQDGNTSIFPILLSQYATALTDNRLANLLPTAFDSKSRLPQPLLFALLKLQSEARRFDVVLRMLLAHIDKKNEDNRHILLYNLSKVWSLQGETSKQIFYLQTLLKEVPFFCWAAYDLALCLSKDVTRIPQGLALLQRHLNGPNSQNALIHAALIQLASKVHLPVNNLLRMLHNKNLTLSNHYNLGIYLMKKGDFQRAETIFSDLVQRLEALSGAEPRVWKDQESKLLILSKINILKIKHKLGSKDLERLASSVIEVHKAKLDTDTIRSISSFNQAACVNSADLKDRYFLSQQGSSQNKPKQCSSHKEDSFDQSYAETRRKNNFKLQYLLKKEKSIDQFFKNLKLKDTGGSDRWKVVLSSSIKSAQQQLQESRSSYSRRDKGQEELAQVQQNFEFIKKVQESRFSGMNIQQIIQNILFRLDTLNSASIPAKKQHQDEAASRAYLKQIQSFSKLPPSGHSPLQTCTMANRIKFQQKSNIKPAVISQLKPVKSPAMEKTAPRQSTRLISLQKAISDRNLSKFRIKPLSKIHNPVQNSGKHQTDFRKKSQIYSIVSKVENYKHGNHEFQDDQTKVKGYKNEQKGISSLNLQESEQIGEQRLILQTNQKQKKEDVEGKKEQTSDVEVSKEPASEVEVSKELAFEVEVSKEQTSEVEVSKEPASEVEESKEPASEAEKVMSSDPTICIVEVPAYQSVDQINLAARQTCIPQNEEVENENQERYLGPMLAPLDLGQPSLKDLRLATNADTSQISYKQLSQNAVQPSPSIFQQQKQKSLASQSQNKSSFPLISQQQSAPFALYELPGSSKTWSQQIVSQPPQSLPLEQKTSVKTGTFEPFASTFNLTGFANTQLNDFSVKPNTSITNTFNIFEQAFGLKPSSKPEPSSEEFQTSIEKVRQLEDQGKLEEAYSKLRQLYKQFKREKEKTRILLKIGQIFEKQQKLIEAEKTYAKCTKFNSAEAFLALGSLQLKLDKIEEGVENLQKANCLKRFDLQIQNRLVYGYSMREQTMDKALNLAHNILKKQPNSLETLLITAGILQRQGKLQEAIQIVAAMDEVRKTQYVKHYLGILYLQSSNLKEAFKCFKSALGMKPDYVPSLIEVASIISQSHPHESIAILNKVLQISPGNRKALARLGKIYEAESDFENAMLTYKIGLESQVNYQSYMKIGDCLYKKESYIEALLNYKQALNLKKTHEAYTKVALMYELKGQYSRAIQYYQSALSILGQTPQVWETRRSNLIAIGRLNVLLGQYQGAIASLQEDELIQGQTSLDVLQLLGEAYFGNKQYPLALTYLEKANTLANGSNIQILQTMAMCFDRMEQYLASKAIYEKIIQKHPDNLRCLNNLANILLITGQTNEAFYLFESLLQKSPKNLEKRLKVADIYAEVGDWSKVEYHLLQCYRQRQHDSRILQKLILLYKQKRDGKMAAKFEKKLALVRANHKNKNT